MIDVPTELLRLADVAAELPGSRAQHLSERIQMLAQHLKAQLYIMNAAESRTATEFQPPDQGGARPPHLYS